MLELFLWDSSSPGGHVVKLQENLHKRFEDDTALHHQWTDISQRAIEAITDLLPRGSTTSMTIQPDYSEAPPPRIETATLETVDFDESQVLHSTRAKDAIPKTYVMNDLRIIITIDTAVNGDGPLRVNPCEIIGFGTGDIIVDKGSTLKEDMDANLVWSIPTDTDLIIWGVHTSEEGEPKETKAMTPLADAFALALDTFGLDDVGLQFHKLDPKTANDSEVRLRYNLTETAKTTAFVPDEESEDKAKKIDLKRMELGACFKGNFKKLPGQHAKVLWDCKLHMPAPSQFRPVKPKLWITTEVTLEPGKYSVLN